MTLDWDFFYDNWLIDRVPDDLEIVIEEHPNGMVINPPSLTCYFGANPIYLYGLGKLQHEVIMSPSGLYIYPEFLERPGFEFIDISSFKVSFDEEEDFNGNSVLGKHIGMVNASRYLKSIFNNIHGTTTGYSGVRMPSADLRRLNTDDYRLQTEGIRAGQVYANTTEMSDEGCIFYTTMRILDGSRSLIDQITGVRLEVTSPGAVISVPGTFGNVVFLRYSSIIMPSHIQDTIASNEFQIFFMTNENFRTGVVLDFGSTEFSQIDNYGMRVELTLDGVQIIVNDGSFHSLFFPVKFDYLYTTRIAITREGDVFSLGVDGTLVGSKKIIGMGPIIFLGNSSSYISKKADASITSAAGNIEELAIFAGKMSSEKQAIYALEPLPFINDGGQLAIDFNNIPISLSYDLTYINPAKIFISNYFGADIKNIYTVDSTGHTEIAEMSDDFFIVKNGFKVDQVSTNNIQTGIDFIVGENMPILTKLTSDSHIPIKIHMEFKIPEFWSKKNTYNIRLNLRAVDKMLKYEYQKYKTGEFI